MPTRQERRAKLKAEMARVIARGVEAAGAPERWWWAVAAETRYLIDIFRSGGKKRASDAAKHAHEFFERSVKSNNPGGSIDCAKGCFMCCTLYVSATAPEVFLVAEYLRNETPERFNEILERVRAVDRDTRYMDDRARLPTRIRCPLLGSDDACVAYSVRPSACRGFVSSSLEACKRGYAGNEIGRAHV